MRVEGRGSLTAVEPSRTIVIAGAGIGGLTAALALANKQFRVVILEKAERLDEAGAGIQLSPNASRILIELGVAQWLAPHVINVDAVSILTARRGREIVRIPFGEAAALRFGAPYWIVHRADLQAALLGCVRDNPAIELRLGSQFEDAAPHASGVTVTQRTGAARTEQAAIALIGADGIWSSVRNRFFDSPPPRFSGYVAWRGTFDARQLPRAFGQRHVQLWLGGNAHLVAYPISGGARINIVAIVPGAWSRPGWSESGDAAEIAAQFAPPIWPAAARMLTGAVEQWTKWAVFELARCDWSKGPVGLLGDASHAMLPFAAQGAGMAIEDAAVLAQCLAEAPSNATRALRRYGGLRRGRVARMRATARQSGQIYHLRGPLAWARNRAMTMLGGQRLLTRQDWIYDWRVD